MFGDGEPKISGGYGIFYFVDRGGINNQLAQNPPFSGQVNYSFSNGYRVTFTGQAPLFSNERKRWRRSPPTAVQGPDLVDLNNPPNVGISVATLPTATIPDKCKSGIAVSAGAGPNMR